MPSWIDQLKFDERGLVAEQRVHERRLAVIELTKDDEVRAALAQCRPCCSAGLGGRGRVAQPRGQVRVAGRQETTTPSNGSLTVPSGHGLQRLMVVMPS